MTDAVVGSSNYENKFEWSSSSMHAFLLACTLPKYYAPACFAYKAIEPPLSVNTQCRNTLLRYNFSYSQADFIYK